MLKGRVDIGGKTKERAREQQLVRNDGERPGRKLQLYNRTMLRCRKLALYEDDEMMR